MVIKEVRNEKPGGLRAIHFVIPILIIFFSVFLALSPIAQSNPAVYIGISYDLTVVAPLIYLILIRNKPVSKLTAVPFFLLGVLLANFLVPQGSRSHLDPIMQFGIPLIELLVLVIVLHKVVLMRRTFSQRDSADFLDSLKASAESVLKSKPVAAIFSSEVAMIYYSLIKWRKEQPTPNAFTSYRESGIIALLLAVVFIVVVETAVVHLLLVQYSATLAWILTLLSIYTAIQLTGHAKAIWCRYTEITDRHLILRYGIFGDAKIPLQEIESVEISDSISPQSKKRAVQLALLNGVENFNIALRFSQEQTICKAYGLKKSTAILLLQIDEKDRFCKLLNSSIQGSKIA